MRTSINAIRLRHGRLRRITMACAAIAAVWLPSVVDTGATASTPLTADQISWNAFMAQNPLPARGCFTAMYPSREWSQVGCIPAPRRPMSPHRGPRPLVVGNTDDISAEAPSGNISTAMGSFAAVTNVTGETGLNPNTGTVDNDVYTLQLNTNPFFGSPACATAVNPATCQGWEQFIYENDGGTTMSASTFVQYWVLNYDPSNTCPAGWTTDNSGNCYTNDSLGAMAVPFQSATNLSQMALSGNVTATSDRVTMMVGSMAYTVAGDNTVSAATGWTIAEFNVFGDCCMTQATFNNGADMVPKTQIVYGGTAAPICDAFGFTGETNNLSFGSTPPSTSGQGPALTFDENTAGTTPANCAAATSWGDTHNVTVRGLHYDFQASGDYLLAQTSPNFAVQERLARSTNPNWPNTSVQRAIATRMGKTTVGLCDDPTQLYVNGSPTVLSNGIPLETPDGVDITRVGSTYFVTSPRGDSVRAQVYTSPDYMNVNVGFGHSPVHAVGLLANAYNVPGLLADTVNATGLLPDVNGNGNLNEIAARDGTVLANPFSFDKLYHLYGDSWRVPEQESILPACGAVSAGNPTKTFFAGDLDQQTYQSSRNTCLAAGVNGSTLPGVPVSVLPKTVIAPAPPVGNDSVVLDDCTLDVGVLGTPEAARLYVGMRQPNSVGVVRDDSTPGPNCLQLASIATSGVPLGGGYCVW